MQKYSRQYGELKYALDTIEKAYIYDPFSKIKITREKTKNAYIVLEIEGKFTQKELLEIFT